MNSTLEAKQPVFVSAARNWRKSLHLFLPLLFFAAMFIYYPFRQTFEFDTDEGGTAMKALLVARGYPLFKEVWSDQPPLLTYLMAATIRIFGPDIDAGRSVVLVLSTILMAAAVQFLRSNWGGWHALAGAVLLVLLPYYNQLSASLMVGLPAIALATLSLSALGVWHQRGQERWLILSALALGLSVLTKLFTGFLAPIFVVGILLAQWAKSGRSIHWRSLLRPALLWSLVFVAAGLSVALLLVGPANLKQLIIPHIASRIVPAYIIRARTETISFHLRDAWPILLLAEFGFIFVVLERRWTSLYLVAWALVAYLLLSFHLPIWYHHQHLITIPAAILAAIAVGEAIRLLPQIIRSRDFLSLRALLVFFTLIRLAIALSVRLPLTLPDFDHRPVFISKGAHAPWNEQVLLDLMASYAPETHWVVTDMPTYAFRLNMIVPPYLSVISTKRLDTGELKEEQIIQVVKEYQPEQVLTGFRVFPELEQYLQKDYQLLYTRGKRQYYVLKRLVAGGE